MNKHRGIGQLLIIFASVVIVIAGMKYSATLLIPFIVSIFLSILAYPVVAWLEKRRLGLSLSITLVVLAMTVMLVLFTGLLAKTASDFALSLPTYKLQLKDAILGFMAYLGKMGINTNEFDPFKLLDPGQAMSFIGKMLNSMSGMLSQSVLIVITVVFMLFEAGTFPAKMMRAWGIENNRLDALYEASGAIVKYLALKTGISLFAALIVVGWVSILGLDFPLLWGLLAFFLNFIPNIGAFIAALPAMLLALIQIGTWSSIFVGVGYTVIYFIIGNVIEPKLMGRKLGLSTLVVFVSLIFWGWLWGPVGMLLSVPLTVVVRIILEHHEDTKPLAIMLGPAEKNYVHKE